MSDTEDKKFYQTKNNKTAYIPNVEPTQKEKERLRAYGIDDGERQGSFHKEPSEKTEEKSKNKEVDTESVFAKQVDAVISGADTESTHIRVTNTPKVFRDLGFPDLPMYITANHIRSIVAPYDEEKHQHGIDTNILHKLPELLADPLMVTKSHDNRYVAVMQCKDEEGNTIIAPIKINGFARENKKFVKANIVLSFYGKNNFQSFIGGMLIKGNVIYTKKSSQ